MLDVHSKKPFNMPTAGALVPTVLLKSESPLPFDLKGLFLFFFFSLLFLLIQGSFNVTPQFSIEFLTTVSLLIPIDIKRQTNKS